MPNRLSKCNRIFMLLIIGALISNNITSTEDGKILIEFIKESVFKFLKEFVNASIDAKQVVNQNNINLIFELIDEVKLLIRKNKDL